MPRVRCRKGELSVNLAPKGCSVWASPRDLWWNLGETTVKSGGAEVPKVLVVEDDQTMSEMLAYNLRRQGLDVDSAEDGADGLRRARDHGVSLIILDVMLPSLDGLSIADELR